jgi:hypothetical protein
VDEYDPQRLHPYAYANNNPTTFSDPDGLFFGAIKNGMQKAASAVASGVTTAAKAVVNNAGTISQVAGTIAMVAAVLPPPAQVVAAAAGAVAAVAGAIDTIKTCAGSDKMGCATGIAGMVPGVRQAKTAARGAGGLKKLFKKSGCNSFVPGTQVLMADGSEKNIEDIELDDQVKAFDPETGEDGARPVTALIPGDGEKHLVKVSVDRDADGVADDAVTATDGHPWWVESEQDWLRTDELKRDMTLLTPDGARVTVIAILAWDAVASVHNLTVDDIHTYYVSVAGTQVLVHNTGDDECPIDRDGMRREWEEGNQLGPAEGYERKTDYFGMKTKDRKAAIKANPDCVYCGRAKSTQADHIYPVALYHYARGWWRTRRERSDDINRRGNLTGACQPCNGSKNGRRLGWGPGLWWPPGWARGVWWPFGGGPR